MVTVDLSGQPLEKSERGIVITRQKGSIVIDDRPIDPEVLRMMVLFFDRIDIPESPSDLLIYRNFTSKARGRDQHEQYLADAGIITRSMVFPKRGEAGEASTVTEKKYDGFDIFLQREIHEPGQWAMANRLGLQPMFRPDQLSSNRGIAVEIFNALPLPNKDISLEDCLRFKQNNIDELNALRLSIGEVYQKISNSKDPNFSFTNEMQTLKKDADNYLAAAKGFGIKFEPINLGFDISLTLGTYGLIQDQNVLNNFSSGMIIGGAAALKIVEATSLKKPPSSPYTYLWSMKSWG